MKLVKAHGNAELVKGPRKPKESKWAKDAQEKDKRDTGAHKQEKENQWPYQAARGKNKRLA